MASENIICMTCGEENETVKSIFDENLHEIYMNLTAIPISGNNIELTGLCCDCVQILKDIKEFRDVCVETHQKLLTLKSSREKLNEEKTYKKEIIFVEVENEEEIPKKEKKSVPRLKLNCPHDSCNRSFQKKSRLEAHLRSHQGEKPEICDICGKGLANPKSLSRHKAMHAGIKKYKCSYCAKSFNNSSHLNVHVNAVHTKEKSYVCPICGYISYAYTGLAIHKRCHSDEKKYQCNECSRMYKTKAELKDHLMRHRGIRDYVCELCNATFLVKSDLRTHQRCVHETPYNFECTECGNKYKKQAHLTKHMRSHTNERPFICSYCNKGFFERATLKKHLYSHTGERPFKCPKCPKAYTEIFIMKRHLRQQHSDAIQ